MTKQIRFYFNTRPFVISHMREPRGWGSWAFAYEGRGPIFAPSSTYTEAKRWIAARVRAEAPEGFGGEVEVKVLP